MPHHIAQRGNAWHRTFYCDDDYRAYLQLMAP
jgi:putative transposase